MRHRGPGWSDHLRRLHRFRAERGLLWVQAAPFLVTAEVAMLGADAPAWARFVQLGAAVALAAAGLMLQARPRFARTTAALALVGGLTPIAPLALARPELVLVACSGLVAIGPWFFAEPSWLETDAAAPAPLRTARLACALALAVWVLTVLVLPEATPDRELLAVAALFVAMALSLRWVITDPSRGRVRWLALAIWLLALLGAGLLYADRTLALGLLAVPPIATIVLARIESDPEGALSQLLEHPARLLAATFLALCVVGTGLLALPYSSASGTSVGILDAAFTSTSGVCVTGLAVLDTPNAFSFGGQVLLALLIQVGGLGIMTFYTVAFAGLGRRLSLRHERAVAGAMNVEDRRLLVGSLGRVLVLTAVSEGLGALVLFGAFLYEGDSWPAAAWRAVFTAVSAFCNAGFALQTDNLIPYADNPIVLYAVGALIVVGGLSPLGVAAFPRWIRGERVSLQATLMLVTAAVLLVAGAIAFALLEWAASLDGLSVVDRVHNAIFQSITLRTAGFNSVDLTVTTPATQTLMIVWMFIGGSPGGTAGGIKTTTLAVLSLTVAGTLRGRLATDAVRRRIGARTVYKATAVTAVGVLSVIVGLLAMQLTQDIALDVAIFEVVSALGTVGLSIGGTAQLDAVGKIIIMGCMFAGRVGPLTLLLFLTDQEHVAPIGRPEEEVDVG